MYPYAQIMIQGAPSIFPCIDKNPLFQTQDVRTLASRRNIHGQLSRALSAG